LEAPEHNIQDVFLNQVRRDHLTVTIYLISGIKLIGKIKSFDKFSILFDAGQQDMLIFKHAISTISVSKTGETKSWHMNETADAKKPETNQVGANQPPRPQGPKND
jgi:host factor-I protein